MKQRPTLSRLRELLTYSPESGVFTWNATHGDGAARVEAGDEAGHLSNRGYIVLCIDGTKLQAHRAAVFYMTGRWPRADVDHINGARTQNAWINLRQVTRSENNQNVIKARRDSSHGLKGVRQTNGIFWSTIQVNKVPHYLGTFLTAEACRAAYVEAKKRLHVAAHRGIVGPDLGPVYRKGSQA